MFSKLFLTFILYVYVFWFCYFKDIAQAGLEYVIELKLILNS